MDLIAQLAHELNLKADNIEAAVKLIDEGNTIPFISRYRKEATGGMDDVALRALDERLSYLRNLEQRKEDVVLLIDAQGKLTPELEQQIREATQLQRVEDLYKPYRKKRMTRAQKAREAGLEPFVNLYHFDMPTYLFDRGGWESREVVEAYAHYADVAFREFGQEIKYWFTFNEPIVEPEQRYQEGVWFPQLHDFNRARTVQYHISLAHALAVANYRKAYDKGAVLSLIHI